MYKLFRGYIRTKNKKCIEPFKDRSSDDLHTYREIASYPEFAGILNDDTILIDVDDYKQSELLYKIIDDKNLACRVYETKRGKHFLFRNDDRVPRNRTKAKLACGIFADIKIGSRNSYSILKKEGKERDIIYDILPDDDEDYQVIPKWLLPVTSKIDFAKLSEGDGRNQELFNYILRLQSSGFSKAEAKETIEIINNYILKDPLDQKELDTILRDEAFQKPVFFKGNTFLHDKFAQFLISEYHIIKVANVLHYYHDGVYAPVNVESLIIKHISNLKQNNRKEVVSYLHNYITDNHSMAGANYIAFRNGIYNLSTNELEDFSPDKIITNKINWDYNSNAYSEIADETLNKLSCYDPNIRLLLEEVIGYCFFRRSELRKCFLLKGRKRNGKSTFIDMLAYLLGENNISSLDLSDLSHEYKAAGLFGKLANLGDDIETDYISSAGIFKKIVAGNRINVNVKFEKPIEFHPYCKLIFSGNSIPRLGRGRDSDAIIDRLIIVPLKANFSKNDDDFDPFLISKLQTPEAMEYLVQIGIKGLKRVLHNNEFTTCEEMSAELIDYEESINPIISFFQEVGDDLENEPTKAAYRRYNLFCIENALKPISQVEFSKRVKDQFNYKIKVVKIDGKSTRIFVKEGDKK